MAKMGNATLFAYQKTGGVNNKANVAFTMFAIYLLLNIYIFATYLQMREELVVLTEKWKKRGSQIKKSDFLSLKMVHFVN